MATKPAKLGGEQNHLLVGNQAPCPTRQGQCPKDRKGRSITGAGLKMDEGILQPGFKFHMDGADWVVTNVSYGFVGAKCDGNEERFLTIPIGILQQNFADGKASATTQEA